MARGRKPLVLQGTADVVLAGLEEKEQRRSSEHKYQSKEWLPSTRLKPGLLFVPSDGMRGTIQKNSAEKDVKSIDVLGIRTWDEASLLGLSVSALRDLALSSGSWVRITLIWS